VIALLLDLANIVGGFLLAAGLLLRLPRQYGGGVRRAETVIAPFAPVVGVVALVTGGYYLLRHAISGPHVFHFEVVGICTGLALLWERLTGRVPPRLADRGPAAGTGLLLAIFGLIAILVGIQGLLTPNG
jgi:hypothetical protein